MSDEFRQDRKAEPNSPNEAPGKPQILGQVPPRMREALRMVRGQRPDSVSQTRVQGSSELERLIEGVRNKSYVYDEIKLPSKGRFYDGKDGPTDGVLQIRPMTGAEEEVLATSRLVKKGQAINMIFKRCLEGHFNTDDFLSADRTFILIWLRGISYGTSYEVEVKCPECDRKFTTEINLNSLLINDCPDSFGPPLSDSLPVSGYKFNYRLSRGRDETAIQAHRDQQLKLFGDSGTDDTLHFRTAQLLNDIEGLTRKEELQMLLKQLPIQDVAYLRNTINDPPFGVDTKCQIVCASCHADFEIDLPLEANFFFPRLKRRVEEQA